MTIDPGMLGGLGQAPVGGPSPNPDPAQMQQPGMQPQLPPQLPPELYPNAWDNHEAHIHYHNQYRKTQEFELLPEHVKQIFEVHVNMHQQALMVGVQPSGGGPVVGGEQGALDPSQQMSDQQSADMGQQAQ